MNRSTKQQKRQTKLKNAPENTSLMTKKTEGDKTKNV